jgi:hypothetical protein
MGMEMKWSDFAWTPRKEVMYVPVKLEFDASTHWLQLDTGCNKTLIHEVPLRQLTGQTEFKDKYLALNGKIGDYEFRNEKFWIKTNYGEKTSPSAEVNEIGTLGLDFLMHRILTIDYPNARFCICDSLTELPEQMLREARFTRIRIKFGKIFLEELEFDNKPLRGIFLDTGSSMFTLVFLLKSHWQKFTGKKGTEQDNRYLKVPAWDQKVTLVGAQAKGILKLRELEIENPTIYFDPHVPASGIKRLLIRMGIRMFKVNGIMGNEPFHNEYTVILNLQQNRLGFLKSLNHAPRT